MDREVTPAGYQEKHNQIISFEARSVCFMMAISLIEVEWIAVDMTLLGPITWDNNVACVYA